MADTPDHGGYWLFAADGGVFAFGDAKFFGSVPGVLGPQHRTLNGPIVAAQASPDGLGYRMFAADGGVFDFGDALFTGSLPGSHVIPPSPITAAASAPIGQGYWLVSSNGGVYSYGSADANVGTAAGAFFGKVVALGATPTGKGLYLFLQSGAVGVLGDATGNLGGGGATSPIVFGEDTSTGKGYWEFSANGTVANFGDAPNLGSSAGIPLDRADHFGYRLRSKLLKDWQQPPPGWMFSRAGVVVIPGWLNLSSRGDHPGRRRADRCSRDRWSMNRSATSYWPPAAEESS